MNVDIKKKYFDYVCDEVEKVQHEVFCSYYLVLKTHEGFSNQSLAS